MVSGQHIPLPEAMPPAARNEVERAALPAGLASWLGGAVFFFCMLFAILLPHSIKGARHAWMIAFGLWLVKLAIERKRMFEQPLAAPMLAYIVLSGLSTALSYDPYLSWGHMKVVCSVALVGTLFAQNLSRLSQVRILVMLLLFSACATAGLTAWQYTYGVGLRVKFINPQTQLYRAGIRLDDVITGISGRSVHAPDDLARMVEPISPESVLRINFLRGIPLRKRQTFIRSEDFRSGLGPQYLTLVLGKPIRAQGTLGHYGIFAEVLMPIGCLSWALLLSSRKKRALQVLFAVIFLALTATIFATQTRAALAGLTAGCAISLLLLASQRQRMRGSAVLGVLIIGATLWIHHARGLAWIDTTDIGTHYRVLMWQDGLRLAWQHPWSGVGMGTIQNHWQEWNIRGFALYHVFYNFHSDIVELAAERGLPTLAAWLWFVVAYVIYLFRLLRRTSEQSRFAAGIVAGVLGGFIAFLITSLVESCLNDDSLVMLLFFSFGMAAAIDRMLRVRGALDVP